MTPLRYAARLVAVAAHEVIAEYRKLDPPPPPAAAAPGPVTTELSCTGAGIRDATQPKHTAPAAARARLGFRPPS